MFPKSFASFISSNFLFYPSIDLLGFALPETADLLLAVLTFPLLTLFVLLRGTSWSRETHYNVALGSTAISFLLSLLL